MSASLSRVVLLSLVVWAGLSSTAAAQASRTWVSGVGDDANPCSRTAPCKTFAGALAKTASGGEINALDAGSFGAVTITKSITLDARIAGGVTAVAGAPSVTVKAAAGDVVVLRGLSLGNVRFLAGGTLRIEHSLVSRSEGDGIEFRPSGGGSLHLRDSVVRDHAGAGIALGSDQSGRVTAIVERSALSHNDVGVSLSGQAFATLYDVVLSQNKAAGLSGNASSGRVDANVEQGTIVDNGVGVLSSALGTGTATARLSNVFLGPNLDAPTLVRGAGSVHTFGNVRVIGGDGGTCASGLVKLSPRQLSPGVVGEGYEETFTVSGAFGDVVFSSSGIVPEGLRFAKGVLSGTPARPGTFPLLISVADGGACGDSFAASLEIACQPMSLAPLQLPQATTGVDYLESVAQSGGIGEVEISLDGVLPAGLSYEAGAFSGYPTESGVFPFTLEATDENGCSATGTYALTVGRAAGFRDTTLSLAASPDEVPSGSTVTLTATIDEDEASGTVTFFDGSRALGTALVAAGVASLALPLRGIGQHPLSASYGGDRMHGNSRSAVLRVDVGAALTELLLTSSGPGSFGEAVTFTASVSSVDGVPEGNVTFFDGDDVLETVPVDASGVARLSLSSLSVSVHDISARFIGTEDFAASDAEPLLQVVTPAVTTTTLESSGEAFIGERVTFTATVSSTAGMPEGSIEFFDGESSLGTGVLEDGRASLATTGLGSGVHTISASYAGSRDYAGSEAPAITQRIEPASFEVSVSRAPASDASGGSGNAALLVTVRGQLDEAIALSCVSDSPSISCSFSPSTVPGTAGTTTVEVTVSGTRAHRLLPVDLGGSSFAYAWILPFALVGLGRRRARWLLQLCLVIGAFGLGACGGEKTPPDTPKSQRITVVARSGTTTVETPLEFPVR